MDIKAKVAAVLREHLGFGVECPPDEFDCCAQALEDAGLLITDTIGFGEIVISTGDAAVTTTTVVYPD